jgi:hypothetical protein
VARLDRPFDPGYLYAACDRVFKRPGEVIGPGWLSSTMPVIEVDADPEEKTIQASIQTIHTPALIGMSIWVFFLLSSLAGSLMKLGPVVGQPDMFSDSVIPINIAVYGATLITPFLFFFLYRLQKIRFLESSLDRLIDAVEDLQNTLGPQATAEEIRESLPESLPERKRGPLDVVSWIESRWKSDPQENPSAQSDIENAVEESTGRKGEAKVVGYSVRWSGGGSTELRFYSVTKGTKVEHYANLARWGVGALFAFIILLVLNGFFLGYVHSIPGVSEELEEFFFSFGWVLVCLLTPLFTVLFTLLRFRGFSGRQRRFASRITEMLESFE